MRSGSVTTATTKTEKGRRVRVKVRRTARGVVVGCLGSPIDFGAPAKFKRFRETQEEALVLIDESTRRFSFLNIPPGGGKSLAYWLYGQMTGKRTLILTENKALQDQIEEDFSSHGLVSIKGANNYVCAAVQKGGEYEGLRQGAGMADKAPCKYGLPCKLMDLPGRCDWFDKLRAVKKADSVVTNYANWTLRPMQVEDGVPGSTAKTADWGKFDLLVCDEVHGSGEAVSKAVSVELSVHELVEFFGAKWVDEELPTNRRRAVGKLVGGGKTEGKDENDLLNWRGWLDGLQRLAGDTLAGAKAELRTAKESGGLQRDLLRDIGYLNRLAQDCNRLMRVIEMYPDEWCAEVVQLGRNKKYVKFQPVWPKRNCESRLFRQIPRVIGVSATIHTYGVEKLGIKRDDYDFWEFDSEFPVENRPLFVFGVAYMKWEMREVDRLRVVHAVDEVVKLFPKEKGVVNTVSYDRGQHFARHSNQTARLLVINRGENTAEKVREYKKTTLPRVLVSPAVFTGFDFADETGRFNVLMKTPFSDHRNIVEKRRTETDPKYPHAKTMDYIQQFYGRTTRSDTDWSVSVLLDAVFKDWYERNGKQYAGLTFREAVRYVKGLKEVREWLSERRVR